MQRLFQSRIDQLDDDTRLRQAEVAVQNILNNVLQRDCNKCFRRWPRLLNYCNKIPVKRRVAFLNRYHCRWWWWWWWWQMINKKKDLFLLICNKLQLILIFLLFIVLVFIHFDCSLWRYKKLNNFDSAYWFPWWRRVMFPFVWERIQRADFLYGNVVGEGGGGVIKKKGHPTVQITDMWTFNRVMNWGSWHLSDLYFIKGVIV